MKTRKQYETEKTKQHYKNERNNLNMEKQYTKQKVTNGMKMKHNIQIKKRNKQYKNETTI